MKTLLLLAGLCANAFADTTTTGDLNVTGQLGIGTQTPRARLEAQMGASDPYALQVSSVNGTAMLKLDRSGNLSIGSHAAQGRLDLRGTGDNGTIGLQLRAGNSSSTALSSQFAFGMASTGSYSHSLRTRAVSSQYEGNAMDFYLSNSTSQPPTAGSFYDVMSLQAISTSSYVSVHIAPFGSPDVELEVSNGLSTGGGRILYASSGPHSERALKTDISYFSPADEERAAADVLSLRHASFRYKTRLGQQLPLMRGLIYEDAPASVRGEGGSVVLDYRLLNLEMALKTVNKKIDDLEAEIMALEKRKKERTK